MSFINIDKLHPRHLAKSTESEQDFVIRMMKGDFENHMGMSFERFCQIYKKTLEDEPEKLI